MSNRSLAGGTVGISFQDSCMAGTSIPCLAIVLIDGVSENFSSSSHRTQMLI